VLFPAIALIVLLAAIQVFKPEYTFTTVTPFAPDHDGAEPLEVVLVEADGQFDQFAEAAALAASEINHDGGIAGRPMTLVRVREDSYDEKADLQRVVADSMGLANTIAKQKNLLAVIGHGSSATAIPASGLYELNDVLFLATHATASSLTSHGFNAVFAMQPSNADIAAVLAHYALRQGHRRFVLLADDTGYATELVSFFRKWVALNGAEILFDGSLTAHQRSVEKLILFLLDNEIFKPGDIDAIFLAASSTADTANFIRTARGLGLTMPIFGPEYIFSNRLVNAVGQANMKDVLGASIYDGDSERPAAKAFRTAFRDEYDIDPDQLGAIGYDAIKLLAEVAGRADEIEAGTLADTLRIMRYADPFEGVTGRLVFDVNGLVTDTEIYVVRHDGTRFQTEASYKKPLDWDTIGAPPTAPALK
jgi:branched-chain amino acid transport system substrate-binding protein